MPVIFSGSTENRTSRNELIEDALFRLLAPDKAEVPSSPETELARQEIEKICDQFAATFKEAEASPRIGKARKALRKMADEATALAQRFRGNPNTLILGAATFNPSDAEEQEAAKKEEIKSAQDELLHAATELDRIADTLRDRIAR